MQMTFAQRVLKTAAPLETPLLNGRGKRAGTFQGRAAIAQVYDKYGYEFPDAGSLESFKNRLVEAAKNWELDLYRLDLPERMERELRERSTAMWGRDEVHMIVKN